MQFNKFKLSAIALAVAGIPAVANAALYNVELVTPASDASSAAATAISADGNEVGVQVLSGPVGLDYSEELPYMVDVEHFINSRDDLLDYCDVYLGYNTCDTWADARWYGLQAGGEVCESEDFTAGVCYGGLKKEIVAWNDGFTSNSVANINGATSVNPFGGGVAGPDKPAGTPEADSTNVVINGFDSLDKPVGASSSPYYDAGSYNARAFQRRGFYDTTELLPASNATGIIPGLGQTNAKGAIDVAGTTIVFGSASVAVMADAGNSNKVPQDSGLSTLSTCATTLDYTDRACQYIQFANQAAIWVPSYSDNPNAARAIASFPNGATGNTDDTAQASVNDAALISNKATLVGFSTYNDDGRFYSRAVKFTPTSEDVTSCLNDLMTNPSKQCWTMSPITGISADRDIYSYSESTGINDQGVIVGIAKNRNSSSGAFAETVFVNQGASTLFLGSSQSDLFFSGYNATAAAINNNNELVGKVDVEASRDRARRQRGYIYLHDSAPNLAAFDNKRGWLLDDLTNGAPGANQFRIAEAFDINDKGDIAASAFYCAGGYSSTAQNALCNGEEELVAVKLTRDGDGTITPRSEEKATISRSGASFGIWGLGLLALGGLLRRRK